MADLPPPYPGTENKSAPYPPQGAGGLPYPTQPGAGMPAAGGFIQPQAVGPQGGFVQPGGGAGFKNDGAPPPDMSGQAAMMSNAMHYQNTDPESGGSSGLFTSGANAFEDKAIRRGFIRKVYGILSIQLLVTSAFIALFVLHEGVKMWTYQNTWSLYVAMAATFVLVLVLACCEGPRRKAPMNYILLGTFTLCESFLLGAVSSTYDTEAVLIAAGICAAVVFGLTIFAMQTKYDFTTCGGMLCGLLIVLMIAGFAMIFMPYNKYTQIAYGSLGALVFSFYLVYDTQLMLGGDHKYALSPEEYVFAALNLYLDIINLFLYILRIVGAARD